jgi:hypothetical protein
VGDAPAARRGAASGRAGKGVVANLFTRSRPASLDAAFEPPHVQGDAKPICRRLSGQTGAGRVVGVLVPDDTAAVGSVGARVRGTSPFVSLQRTLRSNQICIGPNPRARNCAAASTSASV